MQTIPHVSLFSRPLVRLALVATLALAALTSACGPGQPDDEVFYALELDGVVVGTVDDFKIDGATDPATQAHPVSFTVRPGSKVLGWIKQELASDLLFDRQGSKVERKSGSVIYLDREGKETSRVALGALQLDVFAMDTLSVEDPTAVALRVKCAMSKPLGEWDNTGRAATAQTQALVQARVDYKSPVARFTVEIDGVEVAGMHTISGLEHEHEVVEYHDGNEGVTRYRPGRAKYGHLSLARIMESPDARTAWQNWYEQTQTGQGVRKSMSVIFHNDAGEEAGRMNFFECWPTKWKGPDLNAESNDEAIEEIELTSEGIELK